jgi:hypothetical protein
VTDFVKDLETVINCHSRENGSNTPDFILAEFLSTVLVAWDTAIQRRNAWYNAEPAPKDLASMPGGEQA